MNRLPRTPGEAPAREFELPHATGQGPARDRSDASPRSRRSRPAGLVRKDPGAGPEREPELQGH